MQKIVAGVSSVVSIRRLATSDSVRCVRHFVVALCAATRLSDEEQVHAAGILVREWRRLTTAGKVEVGQEVQRLCDQTLRLVQWMSDPIRKARIYLLIERLSQLLAQLKKVERSFALLWSVTRPARSLFRRRLSVRGRSQRSTYSMRLRPVEQQVSPLPWVERLLSHAIQT